MRGIAITQKQSGEKDFPVLSIFSDDELECLDSDNPLQPKSDSLSNQYDGLSTYFRALGQLKPLSKGEDILLGKRIAESQDDEIIQQARQRLAEGSFRLVIHLAKEIKNGNPLLDMRDLIQSGYLGLMTAVDKYKYKYKEREISFSTFSYWRIKKAIYESVGAEQNLVHVPKERQDRIRKYKKSTQQLRDSLSREPNLDEIAQRMNLPKAAVEVIAIAVHQEEMVYIDHLESREESNSA